MSGYQQQSYQNLDGPKAAVQYGDYLPAAASFPAVPAVHVPAMAFMGSDNNTDGQRLSDLFSLGRSVKVLGMMDAGLLLLNSVFWGGFMLMVLLFGCWGPAAGYYAGKNYHLNAARVYLAFYAFKVLTSALLLLRGSFWSLIALAANAYIAKHVHLYCQLLSEASPTEVERLRGAPDDSWLQRQPYFVIF